MPRTNPITPAFDAEYADAGTIQISDATHDLIAGSFDCTNLGIIDVKRAAKVSGPRFAILRGKGALLELALVRFVLDRLMAEGYRPPRRLDVALLAVRKARRRNPQGKGKIEVRKSSRAPPGFGGGFDY